MNPIKHKPNNTFRVFKLIFFYLLILASSIVSSQSLEMKWAIDLYSSKTSFPTLSIGDMITDMDGNIYLAAGFQGKVDLDPSAGEAILNSDAENWGQTDNFIAKYDANGNYIFGFIVNARIKKLLLSDKNELYAVGEFDTIVDFNPGAGVNTLNGIVDDIFIVKYNIDGTYIDGFSAGRGSRLTINTAELDSKNSLYVYGTFRDTFDFDPSSKVKELIAKNSSGAIFLAKYSESQELQNVFSINSQTSNGSMALAIDSKDQVFLAGQFFTRSSSDRIDLDPGPNNTNLKGIAGVDGFWAKYNSNGEYLAGYLYNGSVLHLELDDEGNIYISGSNVDSMDIDLSSKVYNLYSQPGIFDVYIAKYNEQHELVYGRTFEGHSREMRIESMRISANQNVYMVGEFKDTISFDGSNQEELISKDSRDAFIAALNKQGEYRYSYSFGAGGFDESTRMDLDDKGNVWVAGRFSENINVDPKGQAQEFQNKDSGGAVFFAKYFDAGILSNRNIDSPDDFLKIRTNETDLIIEMKNLDLTDASIKIIDITGKTLYKILGLNQNDHRIKLQNLPDNQVLVLQIISQDLILNKKILIR